MKIDVQIGNRTEPLELESNGAGYRYRFRNELSGEASIVEVEPGVYSLVVDGHSYEARVTSSGGGLVEVEVGGHRFDLRLVDPRETRRGNGVVHSGRKEITVPMPGRVVRVLVAEGDTVEAGKGIVVVEAMKMQNELKAPRAGRVAALSAREGESVPAGAVLAELE